MQHFQKVALFPPDHVWKVRYTPPKTVGVPNPVPVEVGISFPSFTGFYTSQVVSRISEPSTVRPYVLSFSPFKWFSGVTYSEFEWHLAKPFHPKNHPNKSFQHGLIRVFKPKKCS